MNTSLGKYQAYDTFVHRLDARVKLVTMIVLMVASFMTYVSNPFMNLTIYLGLLVILIRLPFPFRHLGDDSLCPDIERLLHEAE